MGQKVRRKEKGNEMKKKDMNKKQKGARGRVGEKEKKKIGKVT